MATSNLTAQRLRELLHYDPETGLFTNRVHRGPRATPGTTLRGKHSKGYLYTKIERAPFQLHRLAWLYVHGEWPTGQIDHINGDKADNRMVNLRDVTQSINQQNRPHPQANNTTGARGVYRTPSNTYQVIVKTSGKANHIGMFRTVAEASAAYVEAKKRLHPGYVER